MVPESCINLFCDRLSKVPAPHSINHQKLFPLFDHIFKNFCSHVILHQKRRWNITIDLQKPSSLAVFNTCPLLPKISALDRDTFCLRVAKCANNIELYPSGQERYLMKLVWEVKKLGLLSILGAQEIISLNFFCCMAWTFKTSSSGIIVLSPYPYP